MPRVGSLKLRKGRVIESLTDVSQMKKKISENQLCVCSLSHCGGTVSVILECWTRTNRCKLPEVDIHLLSKDLEMDDMSS